MKTIELPKLQFRPGLIKGGSLRINHGYGVKHYVAGFVQGRSAFAHQSRVQFKRAVEAQQYANKVIERYVRMADAFLAQAMAEVSDVAAD